MHAEDFDDSPHTSCFLPALLATAEEMDSPGAEVVTAWALAISLRWIEGRIKWSA